MKNPLTILLSLLAIASSPKLAAQNDHPFIPSGTVLEKGVTLYDSGAYQQAIQLFGSIDRNDTNYVKALYNIGLCYYADSQYTKSIEINQQALDAAAADPEKVPDILNQYGNSIDAAGGTERALKFFDSVSLKYPAYSLFYQNKGTMLIKLKRYPEAEAAFQKCLIIDPYSYSAHFKLGVVALNEGKVIPALLCFVGYLLNNPEGKYHNTCVSYLKSITSNTDFIQGLVNARTEQPSGAWQLLEQIVQSKIALDVKYKPAVQPDDPILRQIQVVLEKVEYDPADSDFYMQYYIPRYKACWDRQQFELFINRAFYGVNAPTLVAFRNKNQKPLEHFVDTLATYFNQIRATRVLNAMERDTATAVWTYSHGALTGHGKNLRIANINVGPWELYYGAGNLRAKGALNDQGNEEGWWTYYYFNGAVRAKIKYANGNREGVSTFYYRDGTISSTTEYQNGQAEGETREYYRVGTIKQVTSYHANKEDGPTYFFYDNGDSSLMENWSKGVLNGPVKSWSTEGYVDRTYQYIDGKLDGPFVRYYGNGRIETQGKYAKGEQDGLWKSYYSSGQQHDEQNFVNGKREGLYRDYNDSAVITETLTYRHSKIEGDAQYFDDDGKLYATLQYENGLLRHATWFDKTGKTIEETSRAQNQIQVTTHYPDGPKKSTAVYNSSDNLVGTETFYYPSGQIQASEDYGDGERDGQDVAYYSDGKKKDQFWYSGGKLTGLRTQWHANGQLKEQGYYHNDDPSGVWTTYNELGAMTERKFLSDGIIVGNSDEFWPGGQLHNQYFYDQGWLTGMTEFDTAGKILKKLSFPQGTGDFDLIYPDGRPYIHARYVRGKMDGKYTMLYPDGKPMLEETFVRGLLEGVSKAYYRSGKVHVEGQYSHGGRTGVWKRYYQNGKVQNTQEWQNGKQTGVEIDYYESGEVEYRGRFKDDVKTGAASRFDPDGTLAYEINYRNDIPVSYTYPDKNGMRLAPIPIIAQAAKIRTFYPNGKVSGEFEYRDGVLDGPVSVYYDNGQLKASYSMIAGNLNGSYRRFWKSGQPEAEYNYVNDVLHGAYKEYNEKGIVTERGSLYLGSSHGVDQTFDDQGKVKETVTYYYGYIISIQ